MFRVVVASALASTVTVSVESLIFSKISDPLGSSEPVIGSFPIADVLPTPQGVVNDPEDALDSAKLVECTDPSVPVSTKQLFSSMMGCNRAPGSEQFALCAPYGQGGCDNEKCHEMCTKMYHSDNTYESCTCLSWGAEATKFKDFSAGAPCPLKVQPRCYLGSLWRSECDALAANPNLSAADLSVAPQSAWPEGELSIAVKEADSACK